jgi:adenylyltransferase/sulfurtransferase
MTATPSTEPRAAAGEPGPELSREQRRRFIRQLTLPGFDEVAQRRLLAARVLVIGAGGLGSAVLPALAAAGVGTIGIVDDDTVEESNLHRQTIHTAADVGRLKVESAADRVRALAPAASVVPIAERLDAGSAARLLDGWHLVVDGSDNFATRFLVNDECVRRDVPLVWGAISQWGGQVGSVWRSPTYRDLFPTPPAPGDVLSCAVGGVLPAVCAVVGALMSADAVSLLTGTGDPLLGRIVTYDARTARFRDLAFGPADLSTPIPTPEEPPMTDTVTPAELAAMDRANLQLVDVREPWEVELTAIPGAINIPLGSFGEGAETLDRDRPVVVLCHHGVRSERALRHLQQLGFDEAKHLEGGIDAYAREVDPSLPRY